MTHLSRRVLLASLLAAVPFGCGAGSAPDAAARASVVANTLVYASDQDNPPPADEEFLGGLVRLELYRVEVPDGPPVRLTDNETIDLYPSCARDGKRIAFVEATETATRLRLLELSGASRPLFDASADRFHPSWAPDGRRLSYTVDRRGPDDRRTDIAVGDVVTGRERVLVGGPSRDAWPSWSPRRDRVAFLRSTDAYGVENDLYVVGARGGRPRRVLKDVDGDSISWSPGGDRIAVTRTIGGFARIWIVDVARGKAQRLTKREFEEPQGSPAWSSDGRWIAFTETAGVAMVRPDGSRYTELRLPDTIAGTTEWPVYTTLEWCG